MLNILKGGKSMAEPVLVCHLEEDLEVIAFVNGQATEHSS